jgi:4-hydroxybenzoyl-CoA thioesterase
VALDDDGRSAPVRRWEPVTAEDVALEQHAKHLMQLREMVVNQPAQLASGDRGVISQL